MHRLSRLLLALALVISVGPLTAGLIDFDGVADTAAIGTLADAGTSVDFFADSAALLCPAGCGALGSAFSAHPGPATTAFEVSDTREGGAAAQSPFMTDETAGPSAVLDYFMRFSGVSIFNLTLDLLDYRVDGGPALGDVATLSVYSSSDWDPANLITTDTFTIPGGGPNPPDGNVEVLSVFPGFVTPILSARVSFSTPDIGTGIDNVRWAPIPEPGTVILFGTGLLALGAFARKRRTRG